MAEHYWILAPLANYLVIITTDEDEARVARDNLWRKSIRFASVTAPKLGSQKTKDFVRFRLNAERAQTFNDPSSLQPFHSSAIDALFTARSSSSGAKVEWQIQWIINRLCFALDQHLKHLREDIEAVGGGVAGIPREKRLIDETRQAISQNRTDRRAEEE